MSDVYYRRTHRNKGHLFPDVSGTNIPPSVAQYMCLAPPIGLWNIEYTESDTPLERVLFDRGEYIINSSESEDELIPQIVMSDEWKKRFQRTEATRRRRANERRKGQRKGNPRKPAWKRDDSKTYDPRDLLLDAINRYGSEPIARKILSMEASLQSNFDRMRNETGAMPWPSMPLT